MIHALFSDVHNDRPGFEKLVNHPAFQKAGEHISLGDIINAFEPERAGEFFAAVSRVCGRMVLGNHEAVLIGKCEIELFAARWHSRIEAARKYVSNDAHLTDMFKALPEVIDVGPAKATHAGFNKAQPWKHIRYTEDVQSEETALPGRIQFVGHGHIPFIAWQRDGLWYYQRQIYDGAFMLSPDTTYLINTGSVLGSREMRQHEKTFLTYDDSRSEIQFYNLGEP